MRIRVNPDNTTYSQRYSMKNKSLPHQFIAVEGNIGAGKTTLSRKLAEDYGMRLILEQFTDNPFLPFFYENPERYAFQVELFFMTERHKQLQEELSRRDLFRQSIVADYFFVKTLLFARNNLNGQEYRLFQRLFHILNAGFPKPDLLVYLHRPVEELVSNIRKRGRGFENDISPEYLGRIQQAYFEFFRTQNGLPILLLDIESVDFEADSRFYVQITELLQVPFPPGVHRRKILEG
jgi:deoxyguanosine kinase